MEEKITNGLNLEDIYNNYTNITTSYNSALTGINKPAVDPTNKNFNFHTDLERMDIFILNIYYTFMNYFISNFIVKGTEELDFDGQDLIYKLLNGMCGLVKFRGQVVPVNITIKKWNFLNKPTEILINEPRSKLLHNKTIKINEFGKFKNFQEIRFNINRTSLLIIIWRYLTQIHELWELIELENGKIFDKYIINSSILNQGSENKRVMDLIEHSNRNLYNLDFDSAGITEFGKNKDITLLKLEFSKETTDRLQSKWDFVFKEIYKILGIKFNNKENKNGANLVSKEITQEENRGQIISEGYSDIIQLDLEKANKLFKLNLKLEVKSKEIEKETYQMINNNIENNQEEKDV